MNKTRKDSLDRVWTYCDSEGVWTMGGHVIGCGGRNGRKFMIWSGPCANRYEFATLRDAMKYCQ